MPFFALFALGGATAGASAVTGMTLAASVAADVAIGAGVMGYVGQRQQAKAVEQQGKRENEIARYNAELSRRAADEAKVAAREEARLHEEQGKALQGQQIGLYGKSGVDFKGSSLLVLADTAKNLELDRLSIIREGTIKSSQLKSQGTIYEMQGQAAKMRGRNEAAGLRMASYGTLLTGLGTAASLKYSSLKSPKPMQNQSDTRLT